MSHTEKEEGFSVYDAFKIELLGLSSVLAVTKNVYKPDLR